MEEQIDKKLADFRKNERSARRWSIFLTFLPIVAGCLWFYFANMEVGEIKEKVKEQQAILDSVEKRSIAEVNHLDTLVHKKQELEKELMKTYGLPIDSIMRLPTGAVILRNSILANNALSAYTEGYAPNPGITIRYYSKSIDDQKIIVTLKSLGFNYMNKDPKEYMDTTKTNSIWFGRNVAIKDCKIVALAMIRAGIPIKAIRPFRNSETDASYKPNIIDVGGDKNPDIQKLPLLTVEQIQNATAFTR